MKILSLMTLATLLSASSADASGCGYYGFIRATVQKEFTPMVPFDRLKVLTETNEAVTVHDGKTGQTYVLPWERTEVAAEISDSSRVDLYDVLFEEGDGCGPIYRCVTGQIVYRQVDSRKRIAKVFSFPQIVDVQIFNDTIEYVVGKPLLPTFGELKLDVDPLAKFPPSDQPSGVEKVNPLQCGYGNW